MAQLKREFWDPRPVEEVHRLIFRRFSPYMGSYGYRLQAQDDRSFTFERSYRPTWVIVVCIILFPIGLLALLAGKKRDTILASLSPEGAEATRIIFTGEAPDKVVDAIHRLPEA
jgi:hypothetical protein